MAVEQIARLVKVSGRVQGVGFRWFVRTHADRLGVCGWVRNLADGRVEAHLEGHPQAIERLIDKLRLGPAVASVDDVAVAAEELRGCCVFEVRR